MVRENAGIYYTFFLNFHSHHRLNNKNLKLERCIFWTSKAVVDHFVFHPKGSQSCMEDGVILNSPYCDPFSIIFHWLPWEKQTITDFTTPSWSRALRKCKDSTGEPITAKGSADGTDSNSKAWPFATADLEFQEWSIINVTSDMWPSQDAQEHLQDCNWAGWRLCWLPENLTCSTCTWPSPSNAAIAFAPFLAPRYQEFQVAHFV